jgi:hypothetical protein
VKWADAGAAAAIEMPDRGARYASAAACLTYAGYKLYNVIK